MGPTLTDVGMVFVCAVKPGKEDGLTDKQVGIIIGISIGVTCIIICVVVILCRHRSVLSPRLAGVLGCISFILFR